MRVTQTGRSMIEMLGVLAIIGVLSVGGIAGYSKAMENQRVNKTIHQVEYIKMNATSLFGASKNYKSVYRGTDRASRIAIMNIFKKAGVIPPEMFDSNGQGINAFGGQMLVAGETVPNNSSAYMLVIHMNGINTSECIKLVTHDWHTAGIYFIQIAAKRSVKRLATPISIGTATTACSVNEKDNRITFNIGANPDDAGWAAWVSNTWSGDGYTEGTDLYN